MQEFFPPHQFLDSAKPRIFLAGSIEQGQATAWRGEVSRYLSDIVGTLLNPWRPNWDASWEQTASSGPFREQVEWELMGLEMADWIVMYLEPGTRSPISLLELGLFAHSGKMLVCCPEGFWRRGNVQITCQRYGIPFFPELTALLESLRGQIAPPQDH